MPYLNETQASFLKCSSRVDTLYQVRFTPWHLFKSVGCKKVQIFSMISAIKSGFEVTRGSSILVRAFFLTLHILTRNKKSRAVSSPLEFHWQLFTTTVSLGCDLLFFTVVVVIGSRRQFIIAIASQQSVTSNG